MPHGLNKACNNQYGRGHIDIIRLIGDEKENNRKEIKQEFHGAMQA
jgi:hypothetical protein